jgi:hypothetical protein
VPELWLLLRTAVRAGDRAALLSLCRDLQDEQRHLLAPLLRAECGLVDHNDWRESPGADRLAAYQLARLAVEVAARDARWALSSLAPPPLEHQLDVLACRSDAWKRAFASAVLTRDTSDRRGWAITHAWVRAGAIPAPSSPQWVLGVLDRYPWEDLPAVGAQDPVVGGLLVMLLDAPGLGRALGRTTRKVAGRRLEPSSASWRGLVEACGGFDERRDDIVDQCLSGLAGAATPTEAAGFARLVEHLDLTDAELTRRQRGCAALLVVPHPPAVQVGEAALRRVLDAGSLDGDALLGVTPEVLRAPTATRVRDHLGLLDDARARGAVQPGDLTAAVAAALDPDRSGITVLLAGRLAQWSVGLDAGGLDELRSVVAASLPRPWPELRRALGVLAPEPPAAPPPPTAPIPAPDPVDLGAPAAVRPVADLDELLVLIEEVLPLGASVIELERALDGMARLRLRDASAPTRARAARALDRWTDDDLGSDVASALWAWRGDRTAHPSIGRWYHGGLAQERVRDGDGAPPGPRTAEDRYAPRALPVHDPGVLTSRRLGLVRWHHLAGPPAGLLSLPTAHDGTVGADDVLRRSHDRHARGARSERYDVAWALLRVRPEDRDTLLASDGLNAASGERLRLAARVPDWQRTVVPAVAGPGSTVWYDAGAEAGTIDDPVRAWLHPAVLPSRFRVAEPEYGALARGDLAPTTLWASVLPSHPDVLVTHLQHQVLEATHTASQTSMELLAHALGAVRVTWGRPSTWAAVVGLTAEHRASRSASADAVAAAASTGTLTAQALSRALTDVAGPDAGPFAGSVRGGTSRAEPNVTRIAAGLTDAARIHDRAADVVLRGLLQALPDLLARRGAHALVALAAQLTERLGRRTGIPAALADLAASAVRTRTAEEARRLVAAS